MKLLNLRIFKLPPNPFVWKPNYQVTFIQLYSLLESANHPPIHSDSFIKNLSGYYISNIVLEAENKILKNTKCPFHCGRYFLENIDCSFYV